MNIRTFVLAAILLPLSSFGQQQTKITPDCPVTLQSRSTTGISFVFDNRPNSANNGVPCTEWILVVSATTTNVSFSVTMQQAQDNGATACAGCSWSGFGSAVTSEGTTKQTGYADFIRVNLTAISGGTVQATANGWRDNAGTISGGGGSNCVGTFTNGSIVFAEGGVCAQDNANLFFDNTTKAFGFGTNVLASLGTPSRPELIFCSNCTVTSSIDNTCAGSGGGAAAIRVNSVWKCFL